MSAGVGELKLHIPRLGELGGDNAKLDLEVELQTTSHDTLILSIKVKSPCPAYTH